MVMVSGAGGLHRNGGRSPPPKRGRLGGGRCAAAPYKHRLAHDPGRRSRSGRAFRCVGVLGQRPKRILPTFVRTKVGPRRVGVQTKFSIKLAPPKATTNYFTNTPAVAVQIKTFYKACPPKTITDFFTPRRVGVLTMISKRPAPPIGDYRLCHDRHPTTPIPLRARFARPETS